MLHLKCKGQEMKVDVDERIADKYINANKVHFEFCERWAGMIITAQFTQKQDGVDKTYDVVIDELTNMVTMPNEIMAGEVHISAFGVDPVTGVRITSIPVKKTIDKSGFVGDGETPVPPTPDLYAQLLEQFGNGVPPSTGAYKQLVTDKSGAIVWDNLRVMAGTNHGSVRTSAAAAEQTLGYKLGNAAFAANMETEASGQAAFAAGFGTEAIGKNSFAEGNATIANGENQHVQGKYNVKDTANKYAHIVGNGQTASKRANAHTLDWDGNAWFKGGVYVGGDDQSKGEKLVTKSELDAAVAAGGSGSGEGGGGGLPTGGDPNMMLVTDADGNAKWDERTHWKEEGLIDVLPETTGTVDQDAGQIPFFEPLASDIADGETYIVTFNGTEYTCIAKQVDLSGGAGAMIVTILGNVGVITGEESQMTEEPFAFMQLPSHIAADDGVYASLTTIDGSTEATIQIQYDSVVYHKLDPEFLPIPLTSGAVDVLPEITVNVDEMEDGTLVWTEPIPGEVAIGETYTVNYNGKTYTCTAVAFDMSGGEGTGFVPVLGNLGAMTGDASLVTEDPFVFVYIPSEYFEMSGSYAMLVVFEDVYEHTFGIKSAGGVKIAAEALDLDWIPKLENVGELILKTAAEEEIPVILNISLEEKVSVGDKVVVVSDGDFYNLVVKEADGVTYIGNASRNLGEDALDTGEPFFIASMGSETLIRYGVVNNDIHEIELYKAGDSQKIAKEKLPKEFLPDTSALHVVITQNDDETYSGSHTAQDIYKAFTENRPIFCSYDGAGNAIGICVFSLVDVGKFTSVFSRFYRGEEQIFTIRSIDGFSVDYEIVEYAKAT